MEWFEYTKELGALVLVAIVLIYLLRDYLPNLTERYLDQLRQARESFLEHQRDSRQAFTDALKMQQTLFEAHMKDRANISDQRHSELLAEIRQLHKGGHHATDQS